jgi:hypothetical protein
MRLRVTHVGVEVRTPKWRYRMNGAATFIGQEHALAFDPLGRDGSHPRDLTRVAVLNKSAWTCPEMFLGLIVCLA